MEQNHGAVASTDQLGLVAGWRGMDSAPLDGTLVQLLVLFDHNGRPNRSREMHTNDPAGTGPVDQLVRPVAEAQQCVQAGGPGHADCVRHCKNGMQPCGEGDDE